MDPNQEHQQDQNPSDSADQQQRYQHQYGLNTPQQPSVSQFNISHPSHQQRIPLQSQQLQASPYIKSELQTSPYVKQESTGVSSGYYGSQQQSQPFLFGQQQSPHLQSQSSPQQAILPHQQGQQQQQQQPSQLHHQSSASYYQYDFTPQNPQSHERYGSQPQNIPQYQLFQEGSSSQSHPTSSSQQHQSTSEGYPPRQQSQFSQFGQTFSQHAESDEPSEPPHKKKRARKADHGLPGDKGDNELKQLAYDTLDTSLLELSIRIKRLEAEEATTPPPNNPQSKTEIQRVKEMKERQRQLLGMVWLLKSCEASPTAVVPRNRIYARYSGMCADNEITPLSPASFGKLVRILYPDLKTRRLGMRGQSKYHYCGIKLKSDQNYEMPTQTPQPHHSYSRSRTLLGDLSSGGRHDASPISSSNSSISFEDTPVPVSHLRTPSYTPINSPSIAFSGTIGHQLPSVSHLMHVPNIVDLLNSNDSGISNPNVKLELPSIYPYLPAEADIDLADTLYSLYKVHINTLFESLRFMKLKLFFGSFASFNSILTTPVLKLYTSDSLLEWVKLCDVIMYKRMIRMLAKLQLQFGIPQEVIGQLRQISSGFVNTMTNNLINLKASKTFVIMKLKLAKHFVNILNRLVKIIVTGQAASRILTEPIQKEAMIKDWLKLDINEIVLHELPCNDTNTSKLLSILSEDFLRLLRYEGEPVPTQQVFTSEEHERLKRMSLDQIMHKFSSYIAELPGKFPGTNPRLIILLTCNLLTTCLREISLHSNRTDEDSGKGFGAWWIFRCWVDEYLIWCLELGGFFQDEFKPGAISSSSSGSDQEGGQGHGQGQDASEGHGQGQDPSQGHSHSQGGQGQGQGHGHFGGNLAGVSGGNEPSTHEPKQHHSHSNMDATGSSHYDLSNLEANMSTGVVDLLDGNYGSDEMAPEFSSEIVLKYEPTVNDILS